MLIEYTNNIITAVYPGLVESIDGKNYSNGLKWADIINRAVEKATKSIH
jgi:N-acetylated-alpha-linked acidic dipeptidase